MNGENILVLLNELPKYITLFYPGYITIYLYFFFSGKNMKETNWIIAKAIFISYFYGVLCSEALSRAKCKTEVALNISLALLAVVVGYLSAKTRDAKWFNSLLNHLKGDTSFLEDEFETIRNEDRSAWVCIYLKYDRIVYEGSLREVNLYSQERKYICLSGYRKYILGEDGHPIIPYVVDEVENNEEKAIIYYDDIAMMEKRYTE